MKKLLLSAAVLGFSACVFAQDEMPPIPAPPPPAKDKQTEEIIIRNKGDQKMNMTVQVMGDSILVNGKPLDQFINDNVTIRKRKMIIRDDNDNEMSFGFDNNEFEKQMEAYGEQRAALEMQRNAMGQKWKDEWKKNKDINISRPFLGVTTEKADKGVKVVEVVENSAAEKAGLKEGDIITKIGDKKIDNPQQLSSTVKAQKPKDEVKVYYIRDGKEKSTKAVLGEKKEEKKYNFSYNYNGPQSYSFEMPEMPEFPEAPEQPEMPEMMMPRQKKLGLKIQDTEEGKVKVISVEDSSAAAKGGIKEGDIITEIDGQKIDNTDEAREQLHPDPEKNSYKIKINRNGSDMNFDIRIPKNLKTADL